MAELPLSGTGGSTRWRLDVRYDGTDFSGWATQPGLRTVQHVLELALGTVLRTERPAIVCAGRTDAGVHARGQVVHLDLPDGVEVPADLARRLTRLLPDDLAVTAATPALPDFDARFAALWRRYVYRLADDLTVPDPLRRRTVTTVRGTLDPARMTEAGATLLGLRDFAPFCRRRDGATTVRTLLACTAERADHGPSAGVVEVTVAADAFCHSMVRSLVGALVAVGTGRRPLPWLAEVAAARERVSAVEVLPACGLTLEEVGYPDDPDALAGRVRQARSVREAPA